MKPRRIVLASANSGKLREVAALLAPRAITVEPLSAFDAGRVEETGSTFIENAILKARHACAASGLAALADDSGLVVPALDGAPGIHSARFAGSRASDAQNVQKLLSVMAGVPEPERRARFVCTVVYLRHCEDPCPEIGEGSWSGRILHGPRGEHGFGYDPVFFAEECGCTAAELEPAAKNELSHRGRALNALAARLHW